MESLTDLEAAALGCIWRQGGCTAYAVRQAFRESLSTRFSDSAGSVYPMLTRLTERGLLRTREEKQGKREATRYHCLPKGQAALRRWLAVPEDSARITTWDPLRTRAVYLGLLPTAERLRWLEQAERVLAEHLATIRAAAEATSDAWMGLAHRNALLQATARRRWLREVRATLARERDAAR